MDLTRRDTVQTRTALYEADDLSGYDAVRANIGKALAETFHDPQRGHPQRTRVSTGLARDFSAASDAAATSRRSARSEMAS